MSTINSDALEIPHSSFSEGSVTLSKRIAAVRLTRKEDGHGKLGQIAQLDPGNVDLCGPGYNARTVKVRFRDECYFVFREDLN